MPQSPFANHCCNQPASEVSDVLFVLFSFFFFLYTKQSCVENRDNKVQALGLEGLAYLCEADVVGNAFLSIQVLKHINLFVDRSANWIP
jgi:hypothetical protein